MDTPTPGTGGTLSTENPYVIKPTNLGEDVDYNPEPSTPTSNTEVNEPGGETVVPPKNVNLEGLPTEPFDYTLPNGIPAGAKYTDPQYQVGTLEYTVRTKSEGYRNVNKWLFESASGSSKAFDPNSPQGKLPDVASYQMGDVVISKDFDKYIKNIQSILPEGKNTPDDASWYILNVERPRTDHDSRYVFSKIRPLVKELIDKGQNVFDLTEPQILSLAQKAGVDQSVIKRLAAESTEKSVRQKTETSTMTKLRGMVDMLDPVSRQGQLVFSNPSKYLFPLEGLARRDAFLAMTKWKERHGTTFLRGVTEGVSHLIVEAGYGIGGVVEGTVGSLVTIGTGGQVLMKNGTMVLSDNWMTKSQEERDEANRVLIRADEFARKFGDEYVKASGDRGKQAAMIQGQFGEFADPEILATFRRVKELKDAGAYREQMSAERLANFGEGVIQAIPNLVSFFTDSIDPNSFLFRVEAGNKLNNNPMASDPFFGPLFQAWRGSATYSDMPGQELDENIRIWEENYNSTAVKSDPMVAQMYDAIGFKQAAQAARNISQETRLIAAGGLADPITLTIGAAKLLGVGAKAAEGAALAQKYATEIKAISSEVNAARVAAGTPNVAYDTAVATLKAKLEALYPGAVITNDDVVGIVLTAGRSGVIGDTVAAKLIRKETGRAIAKKDVLAARARKVQELLDDLPDKATGVTPASINATRSRLLAGAGLNAAGVATEATGGSINWIGEFLESARQGGAIQGNVFKRGTHQLLNFAFKQPLLAGASYGVTSAAVVGLISQGNLFAAGLAGAVGVAPAVLVRAEFLKSMGTNVAQYGRIQRALGTSTTEGTRYGGSIFVRTAMDLEAQAVKLAKAAAAGDEAAKVKMAQLADDATWLRRAHKSGLEDVVRNASRIAFEDGIVGGGIGAMLGWMNDQDAAGSGAGIGMGFSLGLRAANRLYGMTPAGAQPVLDKVVLADLATMLEMPSERSGIDPSSRARVFEYLDGANTLHPSDKNAASAEYIKRAQIVRDLVITHQGKVGFVNPVEFEASLVLTNSPEADATHFIREATKRYPNDSGKAADYAVVLQDQAKKIREARDLSTALTNDISIQEQKLNKRKSEIANGKAEIVKLEAEVSRLEDQAKFGEFGSVKPAEVEAANVKLVKALETQSRLEAESSLLQTEIGQLKTSRNKAQNDAGNPAPLRPFESRTTVDGNRARKVANGYYIVDGPQGRKTYIDINNIDNLGAISEGWHALLQDAAVQDLMPDMVRMMFGEESAQSGQGRTVAFNGEVTQALINAYAADLPPDMKAKFLLEYQNGVDLANSSGGKDVSGLIAPTQEILTWFMATIDGNKRTAYRPGLATPEGAAASASRRPGEPVTPATPGTGIGGAISNVGSAISESGRGKPGTPIGWAEMRKILFGDRKITDEVSRAARFMFDPDSGMFVRRSAEHMKAQLERSGMRFIEGSDGTFRGYFLNNKNEIIRNPVLNEFYDRVITLTNGRANRRVKPVNLYDPLVPVEQRIDIIKANGMDWMLTEDGKNIHPPERVAQISDAFTRDLVTSLSGIPENQRGLLTYHDPANPSNTTLSGIPSDADMAAVANNTALPKTVRENLLMIMESMASGESTKTLVFDYNNIFSVNPEALTEARLLVGKDIDGKTALRRANPMSIKIEDAPVYGKDGKAIRINDPSKPGSKMNLTQKVIKVQFFGADEFIRTSNRFFEEGLWYRDKEGNKTGRVKDPKGIDYTPDYLISLFGSKEGFQDKATVYLQHLWKAGPIDPYSATPTRVASPTPEILDPLNPERGAAMRDAMRVFFGTEPGQKRTPFVQANVDTNVTGGFAIRGKDYVIWDGRLDQVGPMKNTGESFFMTQRAFTSSQFAMSIKDWGKIIVPQVEGKSQMIISATTVTGNTRGKIEGINVEKVMSHPVLQDVKLFVGNVGGKKAYAYTMGDGNVRHITASNQAEALEVVRGAIGSEIESTLWMREALAGIEQQNATAAKPTVTLSPTVPVVQKGVKPGKEPTTISSLDIGAAENEKKAGHRYVYVEKSGEPEGFTTDGKMYMLNDALVEGHQNLKADLLGTRTVKDGSTKFSLKSIIGSMSSVGSNRAKYIPITGTTRVDQATVPYNHSTHYSKSKIRDTGFTRLMADDGTFAVFQSGALQRFTSMLDSNKVDLHFSPEQGMVVAIKKGEKINKDGSNVLGQLKGMSKGSGDIDKAFSRPSKAKPEAPVTITKLELERSKVPFKETPIDRHGWQDDAMIVAHGADPVTMTNFATTQFGENYQAHGMTKQVGPNTALKAVIKIFQEGIDPNRAFHTAPYRLSSSVTPEERAGIGAGLGVGGGEAWKEGPITLVSRSGKRGQQINNIRDIGFVVINDGAFKNPDEAVAILRERLPKSTKVIKMSEEAQHLIEHKEPGSFEATPAQPEVIPVEREPLDIPKLSKEELKAMRTERDQVLAALREEDPAVIEEERKRITGERIKQKIADRLNQNEAVNNARGKELTAETAAESALQGKSDEGWAMYAAGHAEREAKKLKIFTKEQNAKIREIWEAEDNAIKLVEKQRSDAIKEAQRLATIDAKAAKAAQKAAERFDAIITARQRALHSTVESVLNRQSKDKAIRNAGMEKLCDEFFASNEPTVAPGLLRISSDQLLTTLHRVAYDPATGIAISPYTGVPLVGMPAKPGTFSKPILTSVYTAADRPYPLLPSPDLPYSGPEWQKAIAETVIWRQQFQAKQQSAFEAAFPNRSQANAKISYATEGPVKAQGIINDLQSKIWETEGGIRLVREYRKADAASKGGGLQYRVFGANGMQVYNGTSAEAAREAGERLDMLMRTRGDDGKKRKAGLPTVQPDKNLVLNERAMITAEAMETKPADAKPPSRVNTKQAELESATKRYNR